MAKRPKFFQAPHSRNTHTDTHIHTHTHTYIYTHTHTHTYTHTHTHIHTHSTYNFFFHPVTEYVNENRIRRIVSKLIFAQLQGFLWRGSNKRHLLKEYFEKRLIMVYELYRDAKHNNYIFLILFCTKNITFNISYLDYYDNLQP